jgi:hypothetical protein
VSETSSALFTCCCQHACGAVKALFFQLLHHWLCADVLCHVSRHQRHREAALRVALAACVRLLAMGQGQHTAATLLQYTLSQSAVMAATSLAATVSTAWLRKNSTAKQRRVCANLVPWSCINHVLIGSLIHNCSLNLRRCARPCLCRRSC